MSERETETVTKEKVGIQATGDSGMSQLCTDPDHNVKTNTIWKPKSVAVIVLFL